MGDPVNLVAIVLAAGQGKRMRSGLPKVLHRLAGRPLLQHVLDTAGRLPASDTLVVVGFKADRVRAEIDADVQWVLQEEQLGTGHAVARALPPVDDDAVALVLYGDVPLVSASTLRACAAAAGDGALAVVTADVEDPAELGRIRRSADGGIEAIVEFRDASADERAIREINTGIMALRAGALKELLAKVEPGNNQGEYYLTDVVGLAVARGIPVAGVPVADPTEAVGVNDRVQLAALERIYQRREARRLLLGGVSMADPERVEIRGEVTAGEDCFIDINVVLEGRVQLGANVRLGAGVVIEDSALGDGVHVQPHTVVQGAEVAAGCRLGPFARIRPGTELGEDVRIGNFVETKKARLGRGTKASHLAYLGDAELGEECNVGAGTVTCNYDGENKHRTEIGDNVFLGTNSSLVAPLEVESGAFIAAGSTITAKVGRGELAVERNRQRNIKGWKRPGQRKAKE